MNPLLDQIAVAALITGAVAFFVVRFLRKRASGKSCGSDCGCGTVGKVGGSSQSRIPRQRD
jgi:FeoB-associated Cys-rich membrane protein